MGIWSRRGEVHRDSCMNAFSTPCHQWMVEDTSPSGAFPGMEIDGLFSMAAAQPQPSGAALRSLISGPPSSESERFVAASAVSTFTLFLDRAGRPKVKTALYRCVVGPESVASQRRSALAAFVSLSSQLSPCVIAGLVSLARHPRRLALTFR